jgi:hypothetical protein
MEEKNKYKYNNCMEERLKKVLVCINKTSQLLSNASYQ